jgi:hypothetical protein
MLRSEAVARIKLGLDFRQGTTLDDAIVAQLKLSQSVLERRWGELPRHFIQQDYTVSLIAGSATLGHTQVLADPDNYTYFQEVDGDGFRYADLTDADLATVYLEKMSYPSALQRFVSSEQGRPVAYAERIRGQWVFFPTPDEAYELIFSYYMSDTVLDSDITNIWLTSFPDILIGHAGWRIALDLSNQLAAERFKSMFDEGWAAMRQEDLQRDDGMQTNRTIHMGGML